MRMPLIALALFAAACTPPAAEPPPDQTASAGDVGETPPAHPDAAALGGAPQTGVWSFRGDAGTIAAGFGAPESEYLLTIVCEAPTGKLSLSYEHELAPDQDTILRVITPTRSIDLPARSFNEGLPSVNAELADDNPLKPLLIGVLGAPADRFAVEVAGEISVFLWDDAVARALSACS